MGISLPKPLFSAHGCRSRIHRMRVAGNTLEASCCRTCLECRCRCVARRLWWLLAAADHASLLTRATRRPRHPVPLAQRRAASCPPALPPSMPPSPPSGRRPPGSPFPPRPPTLEDARRWPTVSARSEAEPRTRTAARPLTSAAMRSRPSRPPSAPGRRPPASPWDLSPASLACRYV